jgi:hypothetical protein
MLFFMAYIGVENSKFCAYEKGGGTQGGLRLIRGLRLLNKEVVRYNVLTSHNAVIFPVQSFFFCFRKSSEKMHAHPRSLLTDVLLFYTSKKSARLAS